jgi:hypothetical protein
MNRLAVLAALVGLALVGLTVAGCAAAEPAKPAGPTLPARPAELRVDGVDPCSLVTPAELALFAGEPGRLSTDTDGEFVGPYCTWSTNLARPGTTRNGWLGGLSPARPAAKSLPGAEKVVQVEGFSAIQGTGGLSKEATSCTLIVDIAEGQTLKTDFFHDAGDQPMNHELACQEATKLAAVMIRNLRTRVG